MQVLKKITFNMFNVHKLQAVQFLQASKFKILKPNIYLSRSVFPPSPSNTKPLLHEINNKREENQ